MSAPTPEELLDACQELANGNPAPLKALNAVRMQQADFRKAAITPSTEAIYKSAQVGLSFWDRLRLACGGRLTVLVHVPTANVTSTVVRWRWR